ncbi:MAG: hypothetical protein HKN73_17190 [Gemmatimonadetes bacterium]|nr:hypothetical protein [Gemmatimonadota bacterium]
MMRFVLAAAALVATAMIAGPAAGAAQEHTTRPAAETAANVVEAILAGRDDPAAWGALETALGDGRSVAGGVMNRLPTAEGSLMYGGLDPAAAEPVDGLGSDVLVAFAGTSMRLPAWMQSMESQRIVAGVLAALLALLSIFAGWQLTRLVGRAVRAAIPRRRRGRTLVRRKNRDLPRSRDAERLHAQLRARRAA